MLIYLSRKHQERLTILMDGKSKLLRKWLFTYLILISVSLVFIYVIYTIYTESMKKDITELNYTYLEQVKELMDGQINILRYSVSTLSLEPETLAVTNMSKEMSSRDRLNLLNTMDNISTYALANDWINHISIYMQKSSALLTLQSLYQANHLDIFSQQYFDMDGESFKRIVQNDYDKGEIVRLSHLYKDLNKEKDLLLYFQSYPYRFTGQAKATIIVELDLEMIENIVGGGQMFNGSFFILDSQDEIVFSNGHLDLPIGMKYKNLVNKEMNIVEIDNEEHVIYSVDSEVYPWKYVRIISSREYLERIINLNIIITICIILMVLINFLLAYMFSYRSYRPVKKILKEIEKVDDIELNNEYEYIEAIMKKHKISNQNMEKIIQKQAKDVFENFMIKVLKGYIIDADLIKERFEEALIDIKKDNFFIILIDIDYKKMHSWDKSLMTFVVANIYEEIFNKNYSAYIIEIDGYLALIINTNIQDKNFDIVEEKLLKGYELVNKELKFDLTIGISYLHHDVLGLASAYQECLEALTYSKMLSNDIKIMKYTDTQILNRRYEFDTEKENKLVNAIKSGDYDQAKEIVNQIIEMNTLYKQLRIDSLRCMMFDILSAIVKTVDSEAQQDVLDSDEPITKMMQSKSIEEMNIIIDKLLLKMCAICKKQFESQGQTYIAKEVNEYIHNHYGNPDLNVAHLGGVFNMTGAYLSKLYKKETGEALSEKIHKVRIESAKELLKNTNLSVNDITDSVGYTYSNAFIRAFKKQTGVTPGAYRNLYKE